MTLAANLTNEGGVAGTIRLLRNVIGPVAGPGEPARAVAGRRRALVRGARGLAEAAPAFTAFIDPDDERFLRPGDLPARVRAFCAETGQPVPPTPGR